MGHPSTPDRRTPLVQLCPVLSAGCPVAGTTRHTAALTTSAEPATVLHLQMGWCVVLMGIGFLVHNSSVALI